MSESTFGDLFGGQARAIGFSEMAAGVFYRLSNPTSKPNYVEWEMFVNGANGGLNRQTGDFKRDSDRVASSTLETRVLGHLLLNQLTTAATTPDPSGNLDGLHSLILPSSGLLYMTTGSGANVSMLKETSASDPTVAAVTYDPGAVITAFTPLIGPLAGVLVGKDAAALRYQTTIGTDVATNVGNATGGGFDSVYGVIITPQDSYRALIYGQEAGGNTNGIFSIQTSTAALLTGTYSTTPLSAMNLGGFALGLLSLGGGLLRAWWVESLIDGTRVLRFGSETLGRIVSTNIDGGDKQILSTPELKGVLQAIFFNDGIIAHDGMKMVFYNGQTRKDFHIFRERTANSDTEYRIRGMRAIGTEIIYEVNKIASASGTGDTQVWLESYDTETEAINQITATVTLTGVSGVVGILSAGPMPYSQQNRFLHRYTSGSWYRTKMLNGVNPFYMNRQTSGAQSSTGDEFAASGTATWPSMEIPGLWGLEKYCTEIVFMGDVDAGGTDSTAASVTWSINGESTKTFTTGRTSTHRPRMQKWPGPGERDTRPIGPFYTFQPSCTMSQSSAGTRKTPNGLPVLFRGYAVIPGSNIVSGNDASRGSGA